MFGMSAHGRAGGEAVHVAVALIRFRLRGRSSRAREGGRWVERRIAVRRPVGLSIHRREVNVFGRALGVEARRPKRARALPIVEVIAVVSAHVRVDAELPATGRAGIRCDTRTIAGQH